MSTTPATILIIDDEASVRLLVRRTLERAGYEVTEAVNGVEGVRAYRASPTDVVITDLYMPEQDGIETIQLLREEFPAARIIAMSGGASLGSAGPLHDARLLGADATLPKPFSLEALTRTVAQLLEGRG
jgi:two-component system, chemotaxis family, chemotaxis protein CheY